MITPRKKMLLTVQEETSYYTQDSVKRKKANIWNDGTRPLSVRGDEGFVMPAMSHRSMDCFDFMKASLLKRIVVSHQAL
jgi:hypothetical protein